MTDEDGCSEVTNVVICRNPATSGCTTSAAINYDATAQVDDGSCLLCDAVTGQLENALGNDISDLFSTSTITVSDATVDVSNVPQSDGAVSVSASINPILTSYISLGATETYTMEIHSLSTAGDPSSSTATVATQAGLASTVFNYSPMHTFSSLPYGHYGIKIYFVDSNNVLEVEQCFTWVFATVMVPVCDDPLDADYNTIVPLDFRIPDPTLCSLTVSCPVCEVEPLAFIDAPGGTYGPTCGSTNVIPVNNATECNPILIGSITCGTSLAWPTCNTTPGGVLTYLSGGALSKVWLFNGVPVANQWSFFSPCGVPWTPVTASPYGAVGQHQCNGNGTFTSFNNMSIDASGISFIQSLGSGVFTLEYWVTLADGSSCVHSNEYIYTALDEGCPDPGALNYDPLAQCPGPCIYESWDCDPSTGQCTDPGTGLGLYNRLSIKLPTSTYRWVYRSLCS